ncbi:hypothetical protein VQ643_14980 [Pseudomonas sp. F1_0610]|uniref:hypothetical protein n=1 Tax=Pseudomonas sp. F1_0610 TaxID=3114284 RepID=UPI0039C34E50
MEAAHLTSQAQDAALWWPTTKDNGASAVNKVLGWIGYGYDFDTHYKKIEDNLNKINSEENVVAYLRKHYPSATDDELKAVAPLYIAESKDSFEKGASRFGWSAFEGATLFVGAGLSKIKTGKDAITKSVNTSAKTLTGSKGNPLNVIDGTNKPALINNRTYSGHSLDRMQRQGITPTVVENTIRPMNAVVGKRPGTAAYYDRVNHITVITDTKTGAVITVGYGKIKQ